MAYNYGYYPQAFIPYVPQPQQIPQPPTPAPPQSSMVWINDEKEAALYPIAPNAAVALWQRDGSAVYIKQADASGRPLLKAYTLLERVDAPQGAQSSEGVTIPYAAKSDVDGLVEALKGIDAVIASMRADIDGVKSDLYGLAGKKKKKEVEADE